MIHMSLQVCFRASGRMLKPRNKILVITNILILGFYGYIVNISGYFDKIIGKAKINKNTLKFMEILC